MAIRYKLKQLYIHACLFLSAFLLTGAVSSAAAGYSPPTILTADGKTIRDNTGNPVLLKGFNIETHTWAYMHAVYDSAGKFWSISNETSVIDEMQEMNKWLLLPEDLQRMKTWGANVIRLQIPHYFFESIMNPGIYYSWSFTKLNEWISLAADYGFYVIVDLHVPYGGRQYSCGDAACMEGKTLWMNVSEKNHVKSLWQDIVAQTKHHQNVVYQLMNEPWPANAGASYTDNDWWTLAQQLVDIIRAQGSEHLIVVSNTLPANPFKKISDSRNNIAYDFHFYKPYEFTHQLAWWMGDNKYPATSYPTPNCWEWLEHTYDRNDPDFPGSSSWTYWQETFSGIDEFNEDGPTHVAPTFNSYDNLYQLSFDNISFSIDDVYYGIINAGLENGSGVFPDNWTQWGDNTDLAIWESDGGEPENHYVTIPPTSGKKSRVVFPFQTFAIELPQHYETIRVAGTVSGKNENELGYHANIFGLEWYRNYTYNKSRMYADVKNYILFGNEQNVPVMCLEFGVIMTATEALGHRLWIQDFTNLLNENGIHGAYHVYRGYDKDPTHISFGIYQCWGVPASDCPANQKYEFVVFDLRKWFGKPLAMSPVLFLLLAE